MTIDALAEQTCVQAGDGTPKCDVWTVLQPSPGAFPRRGINDGLAQHSTPETLVPVERA